MGLLVLSSCLFWNYGWLKIHVAFASEQTQIFDEMRSEALQSDPATATSRLSCTGAAIIGQPRQIT